MLVSHSIIQSIDLKHWILTIHLLCFHKDRYASGYGVPEEDQSQDYELISLTEVGGNTTMKFKRKFETCDGKDITIEVRYNFFYFS